MEMIAPAGASAPAVEPFADGIYFGLDETAYHRDLALGSSDLKRLYAEPADYWYSSPLNPDLPPEETTPAQLVGKAVHKLVLEGEEAFAAAFVRRPDDLKRLDEKARKALAPGGEGILPGDDFDRVRIAAAQIAAHPHLHAAVTGGRPEVSVFWTEEVDGEPVRRKARFDYLKPRAVVDLKSVAPRDVAPFPAICRKAIANWNYPTQAAAYLQARARVAELAAAGAVFGDHDPEWLDRVTGSNGYAFVFVFWSSSGAPLTWGGILSPGNAIVDLGEQQVKGALWAYVAARRRFGLDVPWITPEPLAEIELDHMPGWFGRV